MHRLYFRARVQLAALLSALLFGSAGAGQSLQPTPGDLLPDLVVLDVADPDHPETAAPHPWNERFHGTTFALRIDEGPGGWIHLLARVYLRPEDFAGDSAALDVVQHALAAYPWLAEARYDFTGTSEAAFLSGPVRETCVSHAEFHAEWLGLYGASGTERRRCQPVLVSVGGEVSTWQPRLWNAFCASWTNHPDPSGGPFSPQALWREAVYYDDSDIAAGVAVASGGVFAVDDLLAELLQKQAGSSAAWEEFQKDATLLLELQDFGIPFLISVQGFGNATAPSGYAATNDEETGSLDQAYDSIATAFTNETVFEVFLRDPWFSQNSGWEFQGGAIAVTAVPGALRVPVLRAGLARMTIRVAHHAPFEVQGVLESASYLRFSDVRFRGGAPYEILAMRNAAGQPIASFAGVPWAQGSF